MDSQESGVHGVADITCAVRQGKCASSIERAPAAAERGAAWSLGGSPRCVEDLASRLGLDICKLWDFECLLSPGLVSTRRALSSMLSRQRMWLLGGVNGDKMDKGVLIQASAACTVVAEDPGGKETGGAELCHHPSWPSSQQAANPKMWTGPGETAQAQPQFNSSAPCKDSQVKLTAVVVHH